MGINGLNLCMPVFFRIMLFSVFFLLGQVANAQNEKKKWYFGQNAGLDFNTSPPTVVTNGMIWTLEGCSSISDASGNLLFYTDGMTVWDQTHSVMGNGTFLNGASSTSQSALIVKQPGSASLYYLFTQAAQAGSNGFCYSIVDMSLAAGMGSVTVKNVQLMTPSTEKITAAKHCNGNDIWVVSHDWNSNNFRAYLLSATGLNTVAVLSATGQIHTTPGQTMGMQGCMKISPNGKRIGVAITTFSMLGNGFYTSPTTEVLDFDNSTGLVSNPIPLGFYDGAYGVEFSPDGSKLYIGKWTNGNQLYQYDLCAPNATAVAASQYTVSSSIWIKGSLQLAPDGKIYVARYNQSDLGVINNPNGLGPACNYVELGQSISPKLNNVGLPNNVVSYKSPPAGMTYTVSCFNGAFSYPVAPGTAVGCAGSSYSLLALSWNFGDPGSGINNTSGLQNPVHVFSGIGIYTVTLILNNSCGGGTDTLKQVVNINQGCLSVSSSTFSCASLGSATVYPTFGTGPYSFLWLPGMQSSSVATGLTPGTKTVIVTETGTGLSFSTSVTFSPWSPMTTTLGPVKNVSCFGGSNGTVSVSGITGGSASQLYNWTNGIVSYSVPAPVNLSAGTWTATVTDALTGCVSSNIFTVLQPPALSVSLTANSPTACAGSNIILSGTSSGGLPGYSYFWAGVPGTATRIASQSQGTYIFTLSAVDANNCVASTSISIAFVANPTLTVAHVSICPLQTGTLIAGGASSYTWQGGSTGTAFTQNPLVTNVYSVTGSASGCTAVATASIILKSIPVVTLVSNSPLCPGNVLQLTASNGAFYQWSGPAGFNSQQQNPSIANVNIGNSGAYNLTVTAANGCTASAGSAVLINLQPVITVPSVTLCSGDSLFLFANSLTGSNYVWSGPLSFSSSVQNPVIAAGNINRSGVYSVTVTGINGCTNVASGNVTEINPPNLNVILSSASVCAQALSGSPNTIIFTSGGASTYTLSTPAHLYNPNPSGPVSPVSLLPPFSNTGISTATLFGANSGCTRSITAQFTIVPNPTVSVISPTPVICAGQSFTYTSAGASSYNWSALNPGSPFYTSGSIAVTNPSVNSVFAVTGSSLGCYSAMHTTSLTVNPLPLLQISGDTRICSGTAAHLNVTGSATSFTWSPSSYLSSVNSSSVLVSPPANQIYMVTGALNNCTTTAAVSVSVLALPQASIEVSRPVFCLNDTVTFKGSGGLMYSWSGPLQFSSTYSSFQLTANNPALAGYYTLTVTDQNGCRGSARQLISLLPLPVATFLGKMEGCAPFCTKLSATTDSRVSKTWQFGQIKSGGNDFSICLYDPGTYRIFCRLYDNQTTCSNTLSREINVFPKPQVDFSFVPEHPLAGMDEVIFNDQSSGEGLHQWQWHFISNGGYRSTVPTPSFIFESDGISPVALTVKNKWGCADTMVKTVQVEPDFLVYVPNSFSPNGDGLNDIFYLKGKGIYESLLQVFDRWGAMIFESADINSGWDGTYKGSEVEIGTYAWKVLVKNKTGKTKSLAGHINLIR